MPDKPNILLIAIDSIRADHMSCYGYERLTTPHIDRFAQSGALLKTPSARISRPRPPTPPCSPGWIASAPKWWLCAIKVRCGPKRRPRRRSSGATATTRPVSRLQRQSQLARLRQLCRIRRLGQLRARPQSQSAEPQRCDDSRTGAAHRRGGALVCHACAIWTRTRPTCRPNLTSACFIHGDECDPNNRSMDPVFSFKPFAVFYKSWMPPGITDKDYVIAQYDGAIAYMDACIQSIYEALDSMGIADNTIVVLKWRPWRDALRS